MMCQFWDSAEWSDRVTLNWEFSLNSSSVELSIRPIHMKNSKMGLFSKKRELICIIEDWHYWEPIRSPFRHDHVIIDCQSKATLVYNRQFRDWRIFIAFADGSALNCLSQMHQTVIFPPLFGDWKDENIVDMDNHITIVPLTMNQKE